MNQHKILTILIVLSILFLNLASASFTKGNLTASIVEQYSPGDTLRGWINISLQDEPLDSRITAFSQNMTLSEIFNRSSLKSGKDFTCLPLDCREEYTSTNGEAKKVFSLTPGGEKIISLPIDGIITSVGELEFNVSADNLPSCLSPLRIDILNDGEIEWIPKKFSSEISCTFELGMGCFNTNEALSMTAIDNTKPYCEKIKLIESNNFSLGAWVKKGTTAWQAGMLKMYLYGSEESLISSCSLPEPSSSGGEISCIVNYKNNELKDYYVCIKAESSLEGYETKMENANPCGFYALPGDETEYHDYYIFAKAAKFDNIGVFKFDQAEFLAQGNSGELSGYVFDDYIDERYSGNCTKGCSIPIRFKSYGNLQAEVSNVKFKYSTGSGPKTITQFYDTAKKTAKLSSNFLALDLSLLNITVPSSRGEYNLIVYLGDREIIDQSISVGAVSAIDQILPTRASASVPTKFSVFAAGNITSYKWSFGDNTAAETTSNSTIYHTYKSIGTYSLKITATSKTGESNKTFTIEVVSPNEEINKTLTEKMLQLNNTKKQLENVTAWFKEELKKKADLENISSKLNDLERQYKAASASTDLSLIMAKIFELNIPSSLQIQKATWDFLPTKEQVNPDYLVKLGSKADKPEEYKDPITAWNSEAADMSAESSMPYLYTTEQQLLFTAITLKIKPKKDFADKVYLIINEDYSMIILNPNGKYDVKAAGDATAIVFSELKKDQEKTVEFILAREIKVNSLPVFMSPDLSLLPKNLNISSSCDNDGVCDKDKGETKDNCINDCHETPWIKIIIYLAILLFVIFVIYIAMQEWYKKNYEGHLFKNKNDVFNLINFIFNAVKQGMEKSEIFSKLKESGWSGEQITYALKKAQGKRTGMWEIPIFRAFEKKKMQSELEKRRGLGMQLPRQIS